MPCQSVFADEARSSSTERPPSLVRIRLNNNQRKKTLRHKRCFPQIDKIHLDLPKVPLFQGSVRPPPLPGPSPAPTVRQRGSRRSPGDISEQTYVPHRPFMRQRLKGNLKMLRVRNGMMRKNIVAVTFFQTLNTSRDGAISQSVTR